MLKYDFGYEIAPNSTSEWAFNQIEKESTVLEFGPAVGCLTKALLHNKCNIDIVEIDEEYAKKAGVFARRTLAGPQDGNIESYIWLERLKSNRYDAIVFLDVLEHLHDPEKALAAAKTLLSPKGKIYISIPNIAHNSVIINLINNNFEYTSVGLVDETHLRFFTYQTICNVFERIGLSIDAQAAIQLSVGDNEIRNSYQDVSMDIARELRLREYADAYQFMFALSCSSHPASNEALKLAALPATSTGIDVFVLTEDEEAHCLGRQYVSGNHFDFTIQKPSEIGKTMKLLISFAVVNGILKFFKAVDNNNKILEWITDGTLFNNGEILFFSATNNIEITLPLDTLNMRLTGEILCYDASALVSLNEISELSQLGQLCNVRKTNDKLAQENIEINKVINEMGEYIKHLEKNLKDEQNNSNSLIKLLQESRDKEQLLNRVLEEEREVTKLANLEFSQRVTELDTPKNDLELRIKENLENICLLQEDRENLAQQIAEKSCQIQNLNESLEKIHQSRSDRVCQYIKKLFKMC